MPLGARPPIKVGPTGVVTRPAPVARQLASPNGTTDVAVARKAVVTSVVKVENRGVPVRNTTSYTNIDIEDPGPDHVLVDAGHNILQNIEYQSVTTTVRVVIPVAIDTKKIKAGFKLAWEIVDEELIARSKFAAETVKSLAMIKRETEGR